MTDNDVTNCTVYEKEFLVDFIHRRKRFFTEIFVPDRKLIFRLDGNKNIQCCFHSEQADIEEKPILEGLVGNVRNVREESVPTKFIELAEIFSKIKEQLKEASKEIKFETVGSQL